MKNRHRRAATCRHIPFVTAPPASRYDKDNGRRRVHDTQTGDLFAARGVTPVAPPVAPASVVPPPPETPITIRRSLAQIEAAAEPHGFEVVYSVDTQYPGRRVWPGSGIVVQRFTPGVGTEKIAVFRVTRGGFTAPHHGKAGEPDHIHAELVEGYAVNNFHPSEWRFYLGGKPAHPQTDDPATPWALFGDYEYTEDRSQRHSFTQAHKTHEAQSAVWTEKARADRIRMSEARVRYADEAWEAKKKAMGWVPFVEPADKDNGRRRVRDTQTGDLFAAHVPRSTAPAMPVIAPPLAPPPELMRGRVALSDRIDAAVAATHEAVRDGRMLDVTGTMIVQALEAYRDQLGGASTRAELDDLATWVEAEETLIRSVDPADVVRTPEGAWPTVETRVPTHEGATTVVFKFHHGGALTSSHGDEKGWPLVTASVYGEGGLNLVAGYWTGKRIVHLHHNRAEDATYTPYGDVHRPALYDALRRVWAKYGPTLREAVQRQSAWIERPDLFGRYDVASLVPSGETMEPPPYTLPDRPLFVRLAASRRVVELSPLAAVFVLHDPYLVPEGGVIYAQPDPDPRHRPGNLIGMARVQGTWTHFQFTPRRAEQVAPTDARVAIPAAAEPQVERYRPWLVGERVDNAWGIPLLQHVAVTNLRRRARDQGIEFDALFLDAATGTVALVDRSTRRALAFGEDGAGVPYDPGAAWALLAEFTPRRDPAASPVPSPPPPAAMPADLTFADKVETFAELVRDSLAAEAQPGPEDAYDALRRKVEIEPSRRYWYLRVGGYRRYAVEIATQRVWPVAQNGLFPASVELDAMGAYDWSTNRLLPPKRAVPIEPVWRRSKLPSPTLRPKREPKVVLRFAEPILDADTWKPVELKSRMRRDDDKSYPGVVGLKYDGDLATKDIAKRIRADIAEAITRKELPPLEVSITTERKSIRIDVTRIHAHVVNFSWVTASDYGEKSTFVHPSISRWTKAGDTVLKNLQTIANAYKQDHSEPQTDYFNTNFYLTVTFSEPLVEQEMSDRLQVEKRVPFAEVPVGQRIDWYLSDALESGLDVTWMRRLVAYESPRGWVVQLYHPQSGVQARKGGWKFVAETSATSDDAELVELTLAMLRERNVKFKWKGGE